MATKRVTISSVEITTNVADNQRTNRGTPDPYLILRSHRGTRGGREDYQANTRTPSFPGTYVLGLAGTREPEQIRLELWDYDRGSGSGDDRMEDTTITFDSEARDAAGIPETATHFCWANPTASHTMDSMTQGYFSITTASAAFFVYGGLAIFKEINPILEQLVTAMLLERPDNVPGFILKWLNEQRVPRVETGDSGELAQLLEERANLENEIRALEAKVGNLEKKDDDGGAAAEEDDER